jgi:hypothetical protein
MNHVTMLIHHFIVIPDKDLILTSKWYMVLNYTKLKTSQKDLNSQN